MYRCYPGWELHYGPPSGLEPLKPTIGGGEFAANPERPPMFRYGWSPPKERTRHGFPG